jgi:hypothetical protein
MFMKCFVMNLIVSPYIVLRTMAAAVTSLMSALAGAGIDDPALTGKLFGTLRQICEPHGAH